jgi:MFS family permease
MPLVAKHMVGGGPLTFGLLLGAFGAGAVAGALGSTHLRRLLSAEAMVWAASVSFAIAAAIAGVSSHLPITMAMMLVAGAGWLLALSTFNVAVQMSAPRWVVARALSIYQMVVFGGLAAAIVMLICAALGRWLPLSQADRLNLDPLRQWNEPDTAVPIEPRSGPVVITIEYIIRTEDILEFLSAMAERRRIRRRDGALNWRLLRDLADPQVWIGRRSSAATAARPAQRPGAAEGSPHDRASARIFSHRSGCGFRGAR